jgi:hypothetical protein
MAFRPRGDDRGRQCTGGGQVARDYYYVPDHLVPDEEIAVPSRRPRPIWNCAVEQISAASPLK